MIGRTMNFTERQMKWLDDQAKVYGISLQEQMRRVLDNVIDNGGKPVQQPAPEAINFHEIAIDKLRPDKDGTTVIRIWKSSHRILNDFCDQHRMTQIQFIHQLVSAPEDLKLRIIAGEYDQAPTELGSARRAIDDIDPDSEHMDIEQFLYEYCVYSPSSHVETREVYLSYEYFYKENFGDNDPKNKPVDSGAFRSHLIDRGFMPGGTGSSLYLGLGLRPKAHSVYMGNVEGLRLDDGYDE
jgi:hypothetical protein